MSSYLAAEGIDVAHDVSKTNLVFSSDQSRLPGGGFDLEEMIGKLDDAIVQALEDGYNWKEKVLYKFTGQKQRRSTDIDKSILPTP